MNRLQKRAVTRWRKAPHRASGITSEPSDLEALERAFGGGGPVPYAQDFALHAREAEGRAKKTNDDLNAILKAIQTCRKFISAQQIQVMGDAIRGEEGEWFRAKFLELADAFERMPKVYEQDGLGDKAIVHWHFFKGSADWYITERDTTMAQHQAFGYADLFGAGREGGAELGYVSIVELIRANVDFDLHWKPRPLAEVLKERSAR